MAGSGLRPAFRVSPDELERPGANFPDSGRTHWESTQPFNVGPSRPSKGTHNDERETTNVSAESVESVDADDFRMWWEKGSAPKAARGRWKLTTTGRALLGVVAIVGSVLALKGAPSFDSFAYNDPAHRQSPSDKTVAESSDAGAPSGKDGAQSAQSKIAKERLDDLSTQASLAPLPAGGSRDVLRIHPTVGASGATPVSPKVGAQAVASLSSESSSAQSPDLRPARTISSALGATIGARPSSPKLERAGKVTNRAVATTEATVPSAPPDIPSKSPAAAKPAKAEEASAPMAAQSCHPTC